MEKWASAEKVMLGKPRSMPELREEMNRINEQMLRLLNERAQVAVEIGEVKKRTGQPIVDGKREREIIAKMQEKNQGPVTDEQVARFFDQLFQIAKELQAERR
ncbi:chorismate mutase [Laceyella putida]|uniref:Chorismate mutase n=1 Tax=Laceyella putida TaxID=110101 RepID=A0ABW2RLZ3_9BACL